MKLALCLLPVLTFPALLDWNALWNEPREKETPAEQREQRPIDPADIEHGRRLLKEVGGESRRKVERMRFDVYQETP